MSERMSGKTVVLTGGTGDLGRATARLLAGHGAVVVNLDSRRNDEGWDGLPVTDVVCDVTSESEVGDAVAGIVAGHGAPHVLVNAAGIIGRPAPSHESTVEEFDRIFDVNVKGVWLTTRAVVPHMVAAGRGSIVNFSSIHGLTGGSNVPLYHATKGAVRLLSKADAATYGPHGVRVNSLHPGSMDTAMSRASAERSAIGPEAYYRRLVAGNPLPRQGRPEEIAHAVLYLASDESGFTTGAELVVDGGYTAL
ncbi:SDR family oxidoreductase [Pseudonocardia sp. DR1-2]|uniref:SDR family NAD(P)-dependent oxidoreductase n=1 Tax=Pseudonocardia sp. DR1-2 TaxID=2951168 RepID=UPI00204363F2|nr:SDR family NAD(P)-dependent oxidoreductase [Pseudonocardia sp. DR1-2]MCM3847129.1 SDR family oxidoreductase [Pseudonocardia sp. DR1-2]